MYRKSWNYFIIILAILGLLFTAACTTQPEVKEDKALIEAEEMAKLKEEQKIREEAAKRAKAQELKKKAMENAARKAREEAMRKAKERRERDEAARRDRFLKRDIYFEYNESTLAWDSQKELRLKAEYLTDHPDIHVVIEGHCDERGSEEYNLALGERRAEGAKNFLVDLGISPIRMRTVSYGEENPIDKSSNEEAWAKNRRAHFIIE